MSLQKAIDLLSTGIPSPPPAADTAVLLLLANVFAPGAGTLASVYFTHKRLRSSTTYIAVAQMLTVGLAGIGWLWAIAWGFLLYKSARGTPLAIGGEKLLVVRRWRWVPVYTREKRRTIPFGTQQTPQVANVCLG